MKWKSFYQKIEANKKAVIYKNLDAEVNKEPVLADYLGS
jgi:hypothetical protein